MTKLKPFCEKVSQSVQNCLNQNLLKRSFLENGFGGILSSKTDVACAWKIHFSDLTNFSVTKVKSLPGKVRESVKKYLNENLVEWSIIENVVHNLTSKVNVANVWKEHFSVFCWFLSDEFETLFWKSEGKHSKLFQSKFSHKKLLRKWFRSYLEKGS